MDITAAEKQAIKCCPAVAYGLFALRLIETYDDAMDVYYDSTFAAFGHTYPYNDCDADESPVEYYMHQLGIDGVCKDAFYRAEADVNDWL